MRKARVTVPAVATNLGPGIHSLGLALGLHLTVTFVERNDSTLIIESHGEGSADLSSDGYHPVMRAAMRVFQRIEEAPIGLRLDVRNTIPLDVGLGAEAAMTVAGLMGANNLMGMPLGRDELLALGAELLGRADGLVAAMLGGLTVADSRGRGVVYRRVEIAPLKVLVVLPEIVTFDPAELRLPESVAFEEALHNIGRHALLVEALREGDFEQLSHVLADPLIDPLIARRVPGYKLAVEAARKAGALGITFSGNGPAILVFALFNHYRIADAMQRVFDERGILSRVWTLPVDLQGVVVAVAEMHPD
ncbi:MAG: homoserine kinase [Anaerolineae bacterium]